MTPTTKRRWLQFSLHWFLFWHVPFAAVVALIISRRSEPQPAPDLLRLNIAFHAIGEAILFNMKICAGILLTVIWIAVPTITGPVRRKWRDRGIRPATND
jgi:hypothetical protein